MQKRMSKLNRMRMLGILHCNTESGEGGASGGENAPTIEQLQSQLAEVTASFESVRAKNEELLTETKAAKAARREAEAKALAEAEAKARDAGDHEQLYKSATEKLNSTLGELEELRGSVANEKRNNAAMKLATELADGSNAELLSEFIARRLKFTEEGLKVTDANGNLTVSSMDDLKNEFKASPRYVALLKGNQSSGGGAAGGSNGGGAAKTYTRVEFSALHPAKQAEVAKLAREGKATIEN